MTLISRDPFARQELHRECLPANRATCSWCGSTRKAGTLYRYYTATDAGRRSPHAGLFCNKICHDAFHER